MIPQKTQNFILAVTVTSLGTPPARQDSIGVYDSKIVAPKAPTKWQMSSSEKRFYSTLLKKGNIFPFWLLPVFICLGRRFYTACGRESYLCPNPQKLWIRYVSEQGMIQVTNWVKVASQRTIRQGDYSGLSSIHKGSLKMEQEAEESVSEGCDVTHLTTSGLEPRIQCLCRLDRPGNSFSPKAPMKEYSPANTLTLGQWNPHQNSPEL